MTNSISDDLFFAWLDGELDADQAAGVAARVAQDSELTKRAEEHRTMQASLRAAFAPLMDSVAPSRIVPEAEAPISFANAKRARDERIASRMPGRLPQWAAIAATLVLGVGLGSTLSLRQDPTDNSPVTVAGGHMVAASALDTALDQQLASAQGTTAGPRIGLTFRASDGQLCRSFSGASGASGLACRSGEQWEVRGLFSGSSASGDYRMAAGEDPRLAALIDETIAGDPLDAAAEASAKANNWR